MYRGWLQFGGVEVANAARVVAYMDNCQTNSRVEVMHDDSWPDTPIYLDQDPYVDPATDGAPWSQQAVPASAEFLGVWPMSVEGLDSTVLSREVLESAGSGAQFGRPHPKPRKINVEAVLIATTPEGVEYGLQWFNAALRGDLCAEPDAPRDLRFLDVTPPIAWDDTNAQVIAKALPHERQCYDVAMTSPAEIKQRFGQYAPERRQATAFTVNFELTAANPFIWKAPRALTNNVTMASGVAQTVSFEKTVNGVCPSACPPDAPPLYDPNLPAPVALPRPLTPASAVGCAPIQSKRSVVVIPATAVNQWETLVPTVMIQTGPQAERYVRIQWSRGLDTSDQGCDSIGEVMIGYIPANSVFTLDGVTGEARCQTGTNPEVDATSVVSGRLGGPWRPPELRCGSEHTLVLDAASTVHATAIAVVTAQTRAA